MLSDSCFQLVDDLLKTITEYDYSDDFKSELIKIIMEINQIKDEIDRHDGIDLLKNNKKESKRIAKKMFRNAQKKRKNDRVGFYDAVF